MDSHRAKRRKHNGGQYEQLNDDTDSLRSSISRRRDHESRRTYNDKESRSSLCDRCWSSRVRSRATKRCLNCRQNLCTYCAKMDESRRRSWWPSLLISCWRFLFLKAFRRHTIVNLDRAGGASEQNIHDSERTRSMTRNETPRSSYSRSRDSGYEHYRGRRDDTNSLSNPNERRENLSRPQTPKQGQRRYYCPNAQALYRAYSFDKHLNKRKTGDQRDQHLRRTRSAERLPNKEFVDREYEFRKLYHQNWESEPFDFHRAHVGNHPGQRQETGNEDNQKAVNKENVHPNEQKPTAETNERRFKRGKTSRRGIKHVADIFPESNKPSKSASSDNYPKDATSEPQFKSDGYSPQSHLHNAKPQDINEPIFKDHFRGDEHSPQRDLHKTRPRDINEPNFKDQFRNDGYSHQRRQLHNTGRRDVNEQSFHGASAKECYAESVPITPYIVEEPPDDCPVCLETIPCRQARRLHCSHSIHTRCLIDLLSKMEFDFGVKCPICNQITHIRNYYMARHHWYKELPVVTS